MCQSLFYIKTKKGFDKLWKKIIELINNEKQNNVNYKKQKGIVTTTQRVINSANVTVNNLESASGLMPTGLITTTGQTATSLIPSLPGA